MASRFLTKLANAIHQQNAGRPIDYSNLPGLSLCRTLSIIPPIIGAKIRVIASYAVRTRDLIAALHLATSAGIAGFGLADLAAFAESSIDVSGIKILPILHHPKRDSFPVVGSNLMETKKAMKSGLGSASSALSALWLGICTSVRIYLFVNMQAAL